MHETWKHALGQWYNAPLTQDRSFAYICVSSLRILVVLTAILALVRVVQTVRVLVPSPRAPGNVVYWLRYWLLLAVRENRTLKFGIALLICSLLIQVIVGQDDSFVNLNRYLIQIELALGCIAIGVGKLASRHRRTLEELHVQAR